MRPERHQCSLCQQLHEEHLFEQVPIVTKHRDGQIVTTTYEWWCQQCRLQVIELPSVQS